MKVTFHPEFTDDILRFEKDYREVSDSLAKRFRNELDVAIEVVKESPTNAGHFLDLGSEGVGDLRRHPHFWFGNSQPFGSAHLADTISILLT
ncbi:MAG: hypothetical protein ACJASX_002488 [Limisphaerales bacterium]|jgi:hypothetical protein